jgi:tetraacyldisaccharide 4'-kinase
LDDGFQRRDVARQVDILVVHGMRGFGNGLTLPAGPLREPLTALQRADFALVLNEPPVPPGMPPPFYGMPAYRLVTVPTEESVAPLRGKPLVAFAGLAEPQGFFRQLAAAGLTLKAALAYPDHHAYTAADVATLQARAKQHRATLVTTSKDAPKLPVGLAQVLETYLAGPDVADIITQLTQMLEEPAR